METLKLLQELYDYVKDIDDDYAHEEDHVETWKSDQFEKLLKKVSDYIENQKIINDIKNFHGVVILNVNDIEYITSTPDESEQKYTHSFSIKI